MNPSTSTVAVLSVLISALILVSPTLGQKQYNEKFNLTLSRQDITVLVDQTELFFITLEGQLKNTSVNLTFVPQHKGLIQLVPNILEYGPDLADNNTVCLLGVSPGHLNIRTDISPKNIIDTSHIFLRITVAHSRELMYISVIVGWVYFAAWSISFYPQIYINFKRKSVVGLNFDFLALNIVGFILYGTFNIGLFWNPYIEEEYFTRYPMGLNPVLINDVVFALHAVAATFVTIIQCFLYERAAQRVSTTATSILSVFSVLVAIFCILATLGYIHWLDFLYYCSYIKLTITLIKYIPQAVMNYRRKSTKGWSIGNIVLDFTGGILSMLQMILNAYNYDDWNSIFGDPTKFGLGLFSVAFDIFFMVQHYILYRGAQPYSELPGDNNPDERDVTPDDAIPAAADSPDEKNA